MPKNARAANNYNKYLKHLGLTAKYNLIEDGSKIKMCPLLVPNPVFNEDVIGFPDKIPKEFDLVKYFDYDTQFDKVFLQPLRIS